MTYFTEFLPEGETSRPSYPVSGYQLSDHDVGYSFEMKHEAVGEVNTMTDHLYNRTRTEVGWISVPIVRSKWRRLTAILLVC